MSFLKESTLGVDTEGPVLVASEEREAESKAFSNKESAKVFRYSFARKMKHTNQWKYLSLQELSYISDSEKQTETVRDLYNIRPRILSSRERAEELGFQEKEAVSSLLVFFLENSDSLSQKFGIPYKRAQSNMNEGVVRDYGKVKFVVHVTEENKALAVDLYGLNLSKFKSEVLRAEGPSEDFDGYFRHLRFKLSEESGVNVEKIELPTQKIDASTVENEDPFGKEIDFTGK